MVHDREEHEATIRMLAAQTRRRRLAIAAVEGISTEDLEAILAAGGTTGERLTRLASACRHATAEAKARP